MAIEPAPRIVALRESLGERFDRYLAAAGEPLTSSADVTQWLLSQLPGADPEQLGWAVLTVAGLLYPGLEGERTAPGTIATIVGQKTATIAGQNMTMLIASQVGEALIKAAAANRPAGAGAGGAGGAGGTAGASATASGAEAAGPVVVGRELSLVDLTEAYADLRLPAAPDASAAERRRQLREHMAAELAEIREVLTEGIAGLDLTAAGWALTGTGMCLLVQTSRAPAARRGRLPRRTRHDELKNSAMRSAMLLAVIGDFLASPASPA
jgi:hypothetical protein